MREVAPHVSRGLNDAQVADARARWGVNSLPVAPPPVFFTVLLRQFLSPLIYILLAAAGLSLVLGKATDAGFIAIVLVINGMIGAFQEYSAGKSADALRALEQPQATVMRDGVRQRLDAVELVPGDIALVESGERTPADIELLAAEGLQCDEASLTGESRPVSKSVGEFAYAGTMITRGRATGCVRSTGSRTELGRIAGAVQAPASVRPPLMIRMEQFTRHIAYAVGVAIVVLVLGGLWRGMPLVDLLTMSVGLAVSAIPEGLPIAITVALAISMRRMAKAHVIVRHLPAVEALGSCTMIATDKTGTLTLNELTVTDIRLPDETHWVIDAGAHAPDGAIRSRDGNHVKASEAVSLLLRAASLPNEAELAGRDGLWGPSGDTVDIALLTAAHKAGMSKASLLEEFPLHRRLPYEPEQKYAASFHHSEDRLRIFAKGAPERLIAMCSSMQLGDEVVALDPHLLERQIAEMACDGLRVLAFAEGEMEHVGRDGLGGHLLVDLTFLGLAGMQDPIRPEVPTAIAACETAGIGVVVVTGDDPRTARVIAGRAGIPVDDRSVATGDEVADALAEAESVLDQLTRRIRVFARVKPEQKLSIVRSLARNGHFVAVTGDGVNDAPALKHAHVGVAMGMKGTDVAKESADIILTDDNFASIVAGIVEGRVAYGNIRKVVFMLVATGAAEVLLFLLAMVLGLPMPLSAVQLLWLNLVTNGVQDVALVTEPAEGDELTRPARRPDEALFDRLMLRRLVVATLVMGLGGFAVFYTLLNTGMAPIQASNLLLVLFILFENVQCLASRSERRSVFGQSPFTNPYLLLGIIGSQALHLAAMYLPGLSDVLGIAPIAATDWLLLFGISLLVLAVSEMDKAFECRRSNH
ncbi:cation-translocating P-type ATPase [Rhizobium sp. SL42]|uniref:cation-translocating P-type ATPase n=1 Tax=Rhizobium sp. SL42 TaxID=2806346 RepID=UPI001F02A431|nr:HAD-IC family P-type ATPase [Rhizobium sp. SL42]UJW73649.1 HAD-IC family P-type ATPase [Rhizobium sp. SL42]